MDGTEKLALRVKRILMDNKEDIKSQAVVELISNGPIKITGNFVVKDLKRDKEESPKEILLCRCGRSLNKPYCDDSHKK
jgi:hypothetical protein